MTEFFNDLINQLADLKDTYIYLTILLVSYLENVFPPIPGDLLIVFAGYLTGIGVISYWQALLYSTLGSLIGFIHLYGIGRWLGDSIMKNRFFRFLSVEQIQEANRRFAKWGYWLIIFNRFLTGIRAIISLFSGIGKLLVWKTTLAALVSAVIWNALLLYLGQFLGKNWRLIGDYLQSWSVVVLILVGLGIATISVVWWFRSRKQKKLPE